MKIGLAHKRLELLKANRWDTLSRAARKAAEQYSWTAYLDELDDTLVSLYEQSLATRIAPGVAISALSSILRIR